METFFFKLSVVMLLTNMCPSLKPDVPKIKAEAASFGINLTDPATLEKHADVAAKENLRAMALITMMNDAGGPFPCDKVLTSKGSPPQDWEEFILQ